MKELEFKVDFENFYCPITGDHVLDSGQFNPSPAMVFLFVHRERSFEFLLKNLHDKFEEMYKNEYKHRELNLHLTEKELIAEDHYLWITYGGSPFGHVSMCFDMAFENPDATKEHPFYKIKSFKNECEEKP